MAHQSWQITSAGKLHLATHSTSRPDPGPSQALIRLHAISLNYRDILVRDHHPSYPVLAKPNLIPCSDGAGIVAAVGENSRWQKGDRVVIHPNHWFHGTNNREFDITDVMGGGEVDGTLRRWMVVEDEQLVMAPEGLSLEEASTLFTAGTTAFRSIAYGGVSVGVGKSVLTQGTGGVSCFAIMIAGAAGATVVATSSSDDKLEVAKKLGATHLINYREYPNWSAEVLKATNGEGVDLVVDVVGAQSIEQTIKATAFGGVVCIDGLLGEDDTKPVNIINDILFGAKTLRGQLGAGSREVFQQFAAFVQKHDLHPPVAATFEFEQADEAMKELLRLKEPGKVVVRC